MGKPWAFADLARRAGILFSGVLIVLVAVASWGCDRPAAGSPEAVADAFVEAYFRRADQLAAKDYTALGASKMLDKEIAEVAKVRGEGYTPAEAALDVSVERNGRSMRGKRVRFDYTLKFKDPKGEVVKHADIELAELDGAWKVVRIGLADKAAPEASN